MAIQKSTLYQASNLYLKPLLYGHIVNVIDVISSIYIINYLDIGVYEMNPTVQNDDNTLSVNKALWVKVTLSLIMTIMYIISYIKAEKPKGFEISLKDIFIKYTDYASALALGFVYFSVIFLITFIWNFVVVLFLGLYLPISFWTLMLIVIFLGVIIGSYLTFSYLLTHIEPKIRSKYTFLLFPKFA